MSNAIIVFAKAPRPGQVKTRLHTLLSPNQAAALHARLTHDLIAKLAEHVFAPTYLYCHPDPRHRFFQALKKRYGSILRQQQGGNLGARMNQAFTEVLGKGFHGVVLLGCDCPTLEPANINKALMALANGKDVVLAPAEDGGYVLIGLKRPCPGLFSNIPWGSDHVLAETRRRIQAMGLQCHELPLQWDLDRPHDWLRWRQLLARNQS